MKTWLYFILLSVLAVQSHNAAAQSGVLQDNSQDSLQDNPAAIDPQNEGGWNIIPDNAKRLNQEQLELAFSGVTHRGQYRFHREAVSTFAFTETTRKDGSLTHRQGREILDGIWNVSGDQICYTYERIWTYPVCFNIYKSGTCYYHLQRSSDGQPVYAVTARSTPSNQEPDCDAYIS